MGVNSKLSMAEVGDHSYRFSRYALLVIFFLLWMFTNIPQQTLAQDIPPSQITKILVGDAIQSLKNNDTQTALVHLNILNKELASMASGGNQTSSTSLQQEKVLLNDAIMSLKNGDSQGALVHMNLITQQLSSNMTKVTKPQPSTTTIPTNSAKTKLGFVGNNTNMTNTTPSRQSPTKETLSQSHSTPQAIKCGQVVSGNVTLTSNLNCAGDGLIVGADGTQVNLNGYTIQGPGKDSSKVGIMIDRSDILVTGPGAISGFQAGLLMIGSHHAKVSTLIGQDNQIAIFATNTTNTMISEDILKRNTIGIAAHSVSALDADANVLTGNSLAGVTMVNSFGSTIAKNTIEGSTNGIFLDSQSHDNVVDSNTALKNVQDLNNANGLPPIENHNNFINNLCTTSSPSGLCKGT
jgi:parallel beta-helix repeat protein